MEVLTLIGQIVLLMIPILGAGVVEAWFRLYHIANNSTKEMENLRKQLRKGHIGPFRAWKIAGNHQKRTGEDAGATLLYYCMVAVCALLFLVILYNVLSIAMFILLLIPSFVGAYFLAQGFDAISFVVLGKHNGLIPSTE